MSLGDKLPVKIEKGKFREIASKMGRERFTGVLRIYFKEPEISKSEILLIDGSIKTARTQRIKSGSILRGDEAFYELLGLENCTVEIYPMSRDKAERLLDSLFMERVSKGFEEVEVPKRLEFTKPEFPKVPESRPEVKTEVLDIEFERKKTELINLLESEIGKLASKPVKVLKSLKSFSDLSKAYPEIASSLEQLVTFVGKDKISRIRSEFEKVLKKEEKEKLETKIDDEFLKFKEVLIKDFERVLGSSELRKILESLEDWSDLAIKYPQIKKVASKYSTIIPWSKVEELFMKIEEKVAEISKK